MKTKLDELIDRKRRTSDPAVLGLIEAEISKYLEEPVLASRNVARRSLSDILKDEIATARAAASRNEGVEGGLAVLGDVVEPMPVSTPAPRFRDHSVVRTSAVIETSHQEEGREAAFPSVQLRKSQELDAGGKSPTPPVCNTGGVSPPLTPPHAGDSPLLNSSKTKIDTFSISAKSKIRDIHLMVMEHFPGVSIEEGTAPKNYKAGAKIVLNGQTIGWTGWGADHGRNLLYVDGAGCRVLQGRNGYAAIEEAIKGLEAARFTRVDIASDTFQSEVGTASILSAYEEGGFRCGRSRVNPMQQVIVSKDSKGLPLGSTIYVGAKDATKMARCYEKGLQLFGKNPKETIKAAALANVLKSVNGRQLVDELGDAWRDQLDGWYRVEVQYRHDKDRPLKLDMLTRPDENFKGAYPICDKLIEGAVCDRPEYVYDDAEAKLLVQLRACKESYGGLLRTLKDRGLDVPTIFELLVADLPSKKLRAAGIDNVRTFVDAARRGLDDERG